MKDRIRKYGFPVCAFVITLLSALFWVALRINHSGISKFLGADTNPSFLVMNLPVMVTVLASNLQSSHGFSLDFPADRIALGRFLAALTEGMP